MTHLLLQPESTDYTKIIIPVVVVGLWVLGSIVTALNKQKQKSEREARWRTALGNVGSPSASAPPPLPPRRPVQFPRPSGTPQPANLTDLAAAVRASIARASVPAPVIHAPLPPRPRPQPRPSPRSRSSSPPPIIIAHQLIESTVPAESLASIPSPPSSPSAPTTTGRAAVNNASAAARRHIIHDLLKPSTLRRQILVTEVLQPPVSLR